MALKQLNSPLQNVVYRLARNERSRARRSRHRVRGRLREISQRKHVDAPLRHRHPHPRRPHLGRCACSRTYGCDLRQAQKGRLQPPNRTAHRRLDARTRLAHHRSDRNTRTYERQSDTKASRSDPHRRLALHRRRRPHRSSGGDPGEHWHSLQRVITADQNPIRDPAETSHGLNPSIGCNAYTKSNRTPGLDPEIRLLPSRRLTPTFERMSPSVIG